MRIAHWIGTQLKANENVFYECVDLMFINIIIVAIYTFMLLRKIQKKTHISVACESLEVTFCVTIKSRLLSIIENVHRFPFIFAA